MSARSDIADLLWWSVPSSTNAEAKERAEKMLDAYAHELAEQIRAEITGNPLFMSDFEAGQDWAADFIDPEVKA